jgi:hypothetical protein
LWTVLRGYQDSMPSDDHDQVVTLPLVSADGCLAVGGPDVRAQAYPNGPVLVRDADIVLGADGSSQRADRRVVAVCRCGHSSLGVFCDGTHRFVKTG